MHVKQRFLPFKQIITGDESWIYAYDPKTTDQSSEYRLQGQADADSFLRLSWCYALRIPSIWPNCQQWILFKPYGSLAWTYSQKEIMHCRTLPDLSCVFRQKLDPCCSTTTVFTWFSSVWLLDVPEAQESTAGKTFWVDWRDRTWNGASNKGYTYRRLFSMLRRLEETLAQVHSCAQLCNLHQ